MKNKNIGKGTFSITYKSTNHEAYAVDWNWRGGRTWNRSHREGVTWTFLEGLDEDAYRAILERFGLSEFRDELPMEKLRRMSPKKLIKYRKSKRKEIPDLPEITVRSDTIGYHLELRG